MEHEYYNGIWKWSMEMKYKNGNGVWKFITEMVTCAVTLILPKYNTPCIEQLNAVKSGTHFFHKCFLLLKWY